jgi:putative ABC transport system substrate-binding protein
VKRREFIAAFGSMVARPVVARAQQPERMRRIGVLQPGSESDPESQNRRAAFVGGLQKFGWTEGANVSIHYRWVGRQSIMLQHGPPPSFLLSVA